VAAVGVRFRAELRSRWRAWVGLAVLLGLAAGIVAAVAVGARRTNTVVDRFHRELAGYDAYVENYPDPGAATIDPAQIEALPIVASSVRVRLDYLGPTSDSVVFTGPDNRLGTVLERAKVLAGRLPDPRRADEVTIGTGSEQELGARVGDHLQLVDPAQVDEPLRPLMRDATVRVVGVVAVPNAVALPRGQSPGGIIFGTPPLHDEIKAGSDAMAVRHPEFAANQMDGVMVQLRRGAADFPAFHTELERLAKGGDVSVQSASANSVNLRRSMQLQSITLWLLAALLGFVGLASIISAMRQSANVDAADASTLRAVGLARVDLNVLAALRGLFIGVIGATLAGAIGTALSTRVLFGLAGDIEPTRGINVDWTVLGSTLAFVVVQSVVVAMIGGALARRASLEAPRAPALRFPPATTIPAGVGVRFACSGWSLLGRGIVGPALGIGALAGALVFGASLSQLRANPSLYGWRWDVVATNYGARGDSTDPGSQRGIATLQDAPNVVGAAVGNSLEARIRDKQLFVVTVDVVRGEPSDLLPPTAEGEAPVGPGEIALASRTMHRLGARIGDRLELSAEGAPRAMSVTVVGRVVMPPVLGTVEPGEGALMPNRSTFEALGIDTGGELVAAQNVYLRVTPGADRAAVIAGLNQTFGGSSPELYEVPRVQPRDLVDFGRVDGFPLLLGGVLALLAASTLVHVLVSSVRSRRHDLATLRALGVRRRQLAGVVASQSTFLALVAVLVGVPLGILAGRVAWSVYADRSGFISVVRVPAVTVLLLGVLAVVVAGLCAAVPAHIAARTRPAQLLRTE
jgi:ABC-type lipoprotein release transport system permease subunit